MNRIRTITVLHRAVLGVLTAGLLLAGAAHAAPADAQRRQARAEQAQAASPDGVVNINTASAAELSRLPGVGPSKAEAIIELRNRVNRFRRIEDVLRVRGIGRATFRRIRPMLTLTGETTLGAAPRSSSR